MSHVHLASSAHPHVRHDRPRRGAALASARARAAAAAAGRTAGRDAGCQPAGAEPAEGEICECEGCTSILVGKAASVDGSTMTSHSCDSTTDRTWMDMVPGQTHKPGEMATLWMDPKESKGPNDPDRVPAGEIPQVPRTYKFLNAAYPIMNEHQLAIGETTFGGKTRTQERRGHHRLPRALPPGAGARADGARSHQDRRRADEAARLQRLRRGLHLRRQRRGLVLRDHGAGPRQEGRRLGGGADPGRRGGGVGERAADPEARPEGSRHATWPPPTSTRWPRNWGGGARRAASRSSSARSTARAMRLGSRRREWRALSRLAPSLRLDPNAEHYPLSVKPEKKLSVKRRVRHLPRHLRGHALRHDADAAEGGPRREGREEPRGQPVHEQRLPRPAQGPLRADHRLQARHLPVGDPVARVAARSRLAAWSGWATTTR